MEVKEKSKKRELIKTIAIIFLTVMLLLTFFSNTIMNRSLPEVATQMIVPGTINAKIRGSGTVAANESYEVVINQTREIRSVCVKVGDTVAQGDLLFVLGDMESEELRMAQEALSNANLSYQERLLNFSKENATEDLELQTLQNRLQKAIAERDANLVTETDISYAKGDLAAAKTQLSQIDLILSELAAIGGEDLAEAQAAVSEWKAKVDSLTAAVEGYEKQLEELDTTGSVDLDRKVEKAKEDVSDAKRKLSSDWMAYKNNYTNLISDVMAYNENTESIKSIFNTTTDVNGLFMITSDQQMYIDAYLAAYNSANATDNPYEDNYDTLLKDYKDLSEKEETLRRAIEDADIADGDIYEQERVIRDNLDEAEADLSKAKKELRKAESALEDAEGDSVDVKNQIKVYESSKRETQFTVEALTTQVADLEAKKIAYDAAVETVESTQQELEKTLNGKDIDKQLDDLELQKLRLEIQKQQELVDKYKAESVDTEVKSNVNGIVSAINVSAGKENVSGQAMATIDVVDRGYTIKIPVTMQQAKQVKIGDTADVTNYYWGNDITATLEAIAPDPAKPGQGKLLIFRITGEIDPGTNISLSIGQRSANFDTVIPKSALRSDTNGDFVLVMTSKPSPLGNRYIATRVDVQILAEDDTSAAVSGLSANDYVITTSNKPLEAGVQVRMVDEA